MKKISKKKILHIKSSINGTHSYSTKLGCALVDKLRAQYPDAHVVTKDLVEEDFPHLVGETLVSFFVPKEELTTEQKTLLHVSDKAIEEVMEADILIIDAPMYNFGIPSHLKAWLDQISRAGITFEYGTNGPKGLILNTKAYIAMASGGVYSDGPAQQMDFVAPYLKTILGFLGITDVEVLRAEGTAMAETKEASIEMALGQIELVN
ncbi:FMN-dependent NADH-azoreductase [Allomuricauda taeanensis]|uniref:FMN-dependent NADH-azoreductase n=1 Tax=Flagellimonas taeanensis TaxID=1005926 RepID=UPI002E7B99DF|nr:FMN-dependent NADH-azoreductase [Allomuricauda taeanensis]MEE1963146.1 FMN-dependent NADH-azoreductase [Allomuricauda taeanensis]